MKWYIVSPINGLTIFDDDTHGRTRAMALVQDEIKKYGGDHCLRPRDFYIFRGEKYEFIPAGGPAKLVQTDRSN